MNEATLARRLDALEKEAAALRECVAELEASPMASRGVALLIGTSIGGGLGFLAFVVTILFKVLHVLGHFESPIVR